MKVYVAVLSLGYIRKELDEPLHKLREDKRHQVTVAFHDLRPASYNRNNSVKEFLKTNNDYFLTIDHDNVPLRNPLDLIEHDKDIIACPYPMVVGNEIGFTAFKKTGDGYLQADVGGGLQEVDAVGSGVMLVARRVLEKVQVPFERKWEKGVPVKGLDMYFCEKAKKEGFSVWTHWDYIASHYKELDLMLFFDMMEKYGR